MNIGIDTGALRGALTGIGVYVQQVVGLLVEHARDDRLHLYANSPPAALPVGPNVVGHWGNHSTLLPGTFWLQLSAFRFALRDVLDCFWGPGHVLPLHLPRQVRRVLTVHDLVSILHPELMAGYNSLVHRLYFRRSVESADTIIADSDWTKRDLVTRLGVPPERTAVIHLGVEAAFRRGPADEVIRHARSRGIEGDYILSVGTVEPRKNHILLFRALAQLPEASLLVVAGGYGWKCRKVLAEIRHLGLQKRVLMLGYVPKEDLVALYSGARLLVFASCYEGFGMPILQAMACGTPVLASDSSSLPEVGGDAAEYFESESLDSLIAQMRRLLGSDDTLNVMSARGIARAKEFTWERTVQRTLAVLHGLSPRDAGW